MAASSNEDGLSEPVGWSVPLDSSRQVRLHRISHQTESVVAASPSWHLVTGEYPPSLGGVGDYTQQLAQALAAAGERVHVWAPSEMVTRQEGRVRIHGLRNFGPSELRRFSAELRAIAGPKRLFIQYVAPAFGLRGLNVPFCLWLASRAEEEVWVQFHEVAQSFSWRQPARHNVLALAQWWMAQLVAGAAQRIFISVPGWRKQLGRHGARADVLSIPSNMPGDVEHHGVASLRAHLGAGPLVGHFGTYGGLVTGLLLPAILAVLRSVPEARFLLLGRGGSDFAARIASASPDLASRLVAPGPLDRLSISLHLAACDLLVQPYPDGISGRRTSAMAGLALGRPVVTTFGHLTEDEWFRSDAVVLLPVGQAEEIARAVERLLSNRAESEVLGTRGRAWYEARFSIAKTLERLLESPRLKVD